MESRSPGIIGLGVMGPNLALNAKEKGFYVVAYDAWKKALNQKGLYFVGLNVSGREDGARNGPSLMAGGDRIADDRARPMLKAMAARFNQQVSCNEIRTTSI